MLRTKPHEHKEPWKLIHGMNERQLDEMWKQVIYMKFGGRCAKCGGTFRLSQHHLIKRRFHLFRWDVNNGINLDARCHNLAERPDIPEFQAWLESCLPATAEWLKLNKPETRTSPTFQQKEKEVETLMLVWKELKNATMQRMWVYSQNS